MVRGWMTGRFLLAGALMLAACGLSFAGPVSKADLQIASIQVERDVVRVDVVNPGAKSGSAWVVVTVLCNGKPVQEARPVTVKGEGQMQVAVRFQAPVSGLLSTGLVDAAEPQ